jgi:predicted phosphodiesterase
MGKGNRSAIKDKTLIRSQEDALKQRNNPFGLPDSVKDDWEPVTLPLKQGRGLIIADLHIPYHDNDSIEPTFNWALSHGYSDFVLIDGDLGDDYQLSRFERHPEKRKYKEEMESVGIFLDSVSNTFPAAQIILKWGNHDNRLDRYLRVKAPELFDLKTYIRDDYLKLKERGIIAIEHDIPIKVGKLTILHGHEIQNLSTVVNPARGAYMKAIECVLIAHSHRTSQHVETSLSGRLDTAWSIGCLCQLHPEYARLNKWNQGFAGLDFDGNDFQIENKRIVEIDNKRLVR